MFTISKIIPCRRDVETLLSTEKTAYITAIKTLKANGTYNSIIMEHVAAMNNTSTSGGQMINPAHRAPAFCPWHREYLIRLEKEIRKHSENAAIPYWDWATNSNPATAAVWQNDMLGGDGDGSDGNKVKTGPFREGEWVIIDEDGNNDGPLKRNFSDTLSLPTQANIDTVKAITVYDSADWNWDSDPSFRNQLEGWEGPNLHNRVHQWVGEDMEPRTSPNDPVFFFHHCFVDKIWADWQAIPASSGYLPQSGGPTGHNAGDAMYPWTTKPNDVLEHKKFYMYDTDAPVIEKVTNSLTFDDVPEGETTFRAIVFNVTTNEDLSFSIQGALDPRFGSLNAVEPVNPPNRNAVIGELRLWISYTGTNDGDAVTAADGVSVTIRENTTGQEWTFGITANTTSRQTAAVVLALDKSGSMDSPSGVDGQARIDVLRYSATPFANLIQQGNAIGIISFDEDAHNVMPITGPLGPAGAFDVDRQTAINHIANHQVNPSGLTGIGDALERAQSLLSGVSYDVKAVVVLTDGHETAEKYVADVADSINSRVYAIGLGTAEQIKPATLSSIANGTDGVMYVTGELNNDLQFRLSKYYLQILAGITNVDIVTDPIDYLAPGDIHKIPFDLSETDISSDIILLADAPWVFEFFLETPDGDIIHPGMAMASPAINYVVGKNSAYYRITLPVPIGAKGAREGGWKACLRINDDYFLKYLASLDNYPEQLKRARTHGIKYSLNVHAYSNLRMKASLNQNSYEPGAQVYLNTVLTEYGMPMRAGQASVEAIVSRPDNTVTTVPLTETEDGVFDGSFTANLSGVYTCRIMVNGKTLRGRDFTREQTLTAPVWKGGDSQPERPDGGGNNPGGGKGDIDESICRLLKCLLKQERFVEYLKKHGIDGRELAECFCKRKKPSSTFLGSLTAPIGASSSATLNVTDNLLNALNKFIAENPRIG